MLEINSWAYILFVTASYLVILLQLSMRTKIQQQRFYVPTNCKSANGQRFVFDCRGLFLWTWELIPISVGIRAEQTWKWCFTIQCKVQNRKKASTKYVAEHKSLVKADTYLNRVNSLTHNFRTYRFASARH